jgi:hypothetical protein
VFLIGEHLVCGVDKKCKPSFGEAMHQEFDERVGADIATGILSED